MTRLLTRIALFVFTVCWLCSSAHAGYWKVEMLTEGKNVNTTTQAGDWPALEPQTGFGYPTNQAAQFNRSLSYAVTSSSPLVTVEGSVYGFVTARLTWVPSNPTDLPPATISVREVGTATAYYAHPGDPNVAGGATCYIDDQTLIIDGRTQGANGTRYDVRVQQLLQTISISVEGRTVIHLPARRLGFSGTATGLSLIGGGMPSAGGTVTYTVSVLGSSNVPPGPVSNFRTTNGVIEGLTITTPSLSAATAGQAYTAKLDAEGQVAISLAWDAAARATGYTIDRVPTAPGFPVSVTGTTYVDRNQVKTNTDYYYRITPTNAAGVGPKAGPVTRSVELNASDLRWLVEGFTANTAHDYLPGGLEWKGDSTLTGTPVHEGQYSLGFRVKLSDDVVGLKTLSLQVQSAPQLAITTTSLSTAYIEQPYTCALAASGGFGKLTWRLKTTTLSPWFCVTDSGYVVGMPSTEDYLSGTAIEVEVEDESGQVATKTFVNPVTTEPYTGPEEATEFPDRTSYQLERIYDIPPDPERAVTEAEPFEGEAETEALYALEVTLGIAGFPVRLDPTDAIVFAFREVGEDALTPIFQNLYQGGGGFVPGKFSTGFGCTWFGVGNAYAVKEGKRMGGRPVRLTGRLRLHAGRSIYYSTSNAAHEAQVLARYPNAINLETIFTNCKNAYEAGFKTQFDSRWLQKGGILGSGAYRRSYKWELQAFLELKMYHAVDAATALDGLVAEVDIFESRFSKQGNGTHFVCPRANLMEIRGRMDGFLKTLKNYRLADKLEGAEKLAFVKSVKAVNPNVNESNITVVKAGPTARRFLGGAGRILGFVGDIGMATEIYFAEDRGKAIAKNVGYWGGAALAAGQAAIYFSPLAETGPVYLGIVLVAGIGGGIFGRATAGTIYEYYVHGVPPGEPLDSFIRELRGQ